MLSPGESLQLRRARPAPEPFAAVVVRSDTTGVWCARLDPPGDPNHPLGPCQGATRVALSTSSVGTDPHTHALTVERLPLRTEVLLLLTDDGPWVLAHNREVT